MEFNQMVIVRQGEKNVEQIYMRSIDICMCCDDGCWPQTQMAPYALRGRLEFQKIQRLQLQQQPQRQL
ncbi:MAG: hypothetical protein B1H40_01565 [Candidatus Latescibacteria bacterium 4484_181]|nr:MAG: hypothetical protein B1H40_01565 [Candidatus Latescibacteria bacterium 4484_181]